MSPRHYIRFTEWNCYEVVLYLNTPGQADGEARFWVNGILNSRTRGIKFRQQEEDYPNYVQLNIHRTTENFPHVMKRWVDNIVIATEYIGPPGGEYTF